MSIQNLTFLADGWQDKLPLDSLTTLPHLFTTKHMKPRDKENSRFGLK